VDGSVSLYPVGGVMLLWMDLFLVGGVVLLWMDLGVVLL
jgi:hypothetical protein